MKCISTDFSTIMPLGIPKAMEEEHEELHQELRKVTKIRGKVGEAAIRVAQVLHPHFERERTSLLCPSSVWRGSS
jgi:hypothetical protein